MFNMETRTNCKLIASSVALIGGLATYFYNMHKLDKSIAEQKRWGHAQQIDTEGYVEEDKVAIE